LFNYSGKAETRDGAVGVL